MKLLRKDAANDMVRKVEIINRLGIHARPASMFVKKAQEFSAEITVEKDKMKVDAKSIMGLLTLEGYMGAVLTLRAAGEDARQALDALEELVKNKFYED
ncbi:MAG: HPr family phosphocarrier protein [Kiritimatiellia bacterium]